MPCLQLDVNGPFPADARKRLAGRLSATYAELMDVEIERITVTVRELGEGGCWRNVEGEPVPVSVLMCDIRRGRPEELRLELARALCRDCAEILGLPEDRLNVVFTQHTGDEMYHPSLGGWSPDWKEEKEAHQAIVNPVDPDWE
jgi:phenylpyruvate tautomerase PptA (4-oxalocrotonate tautomerase family)